MATDLDTGEVETTKPVKPVKPKKAASKPKKESSPRKEPKEPKPKTGAEVRAVKESNHAGTGREYIDAANALKQVSDPTRLKIMAMLSDGPLNVTQLCSEMTMSQPAVSHHLALCRHGNLVIPIRSGKNNVYELTEKGRKLISIVKDVIGLSS